MADPLNDIDVSLRSLKSLFETGEAKRMYDIATLFPSKISKSLGINHGRYIERLAKPEKFTIAELIRFSSITGADIKKVFEVILKEAVENVTAQPAAKKVSARKTKKEPGGKLPAKKTGKK